MVQLRLKAEELIRGIISDNQGTSFLIGPQHIVSCAHNLSEGKNVGEVINTIHLNKKNEVIESSAIVEYIDRENDIIFAKVSEKNANNYHFCGDHNQTNDVTNLACTFQKENTFFTSVNLKFEAIEVEVTKDRILKEYLKFRDGQIERGFSGSPVICLKQKCIVGMMKETRNRKYAIGGYAIHAKLIKYLAKTQGIPLFDSSRIKVDHLKPKFVPVINEKIIKRRSQIRRVKSILNSSNSYHESPLVIKISGMPGSGKTYLAFDICKKLERSFPDGQLYINLNGFSETEKRVSEDISLNVLLNQMSISNENIPYGISEKLVLWNSLMEKFKGIVLLDNANNTNHIRNLIPSVSKSLILVTSRNTLPELIWAKEVKAGPMTLPESIELFSKHTGINYKKSDKSIIEKCVERCGSLALSIRVVASIWKNRVTNYQDILKHLPELDQGEWIFTNADTDVADAFSVSLKELDHKLFELFLVCCVIPGRDFSLKRIRFVCEQKIKINDLLLLSDKSLLEEVGNEQFYIHDLFKLYGKNKFEVSFGLSKKQVLERCLDYYSQKLEKIEKKLGNKNNFDWLAKKSINVLDTCTSAWKNNIDNTHQFIIRYAEVLKNNDLNTYSKNFYLLDNEISCFKGSIKEISLSCKRVAETCMELGEFNEAENWYLDAIRTAKQIKKNNQVEHLLTRLAFCYERLGCYHKAFIRLAQAEKICSNKNFTVLSKIHSTRGAVYWRKENYPKALKHFEIAIDYDKKSNSNGMPTIYNNIGFTYYRLKKYRVARMFLFRARRAAEKHASINSIIEINLGYVYVESKRPNIGKLWAEKGLTKANQSSNRFQQARAWDAIGNYYINTNDANAASKCWETSMQKFNDCGAPEVTTLKIKLKSIS